MASFHADNNKGFLVSPPRLLEGGRSYLGISANRPSHPTHSALMSPVQYHVSQQREKERFGQPTITRAASTAAFPQVGCARASFREPSQTGRGRWRRSNALFLTQANSNDRGPALQQRQSRQDSSPPEPRPLRGTSSFRLPSLYHQKLLLRRGPCGAPEVR